MSKLTLPCTRKKAYVSVIVPLSGVIVVGLIALIFSSLLSYSIWLGGFLWFFPNGYVAIKLFHTIETEPKRFVMQFYKSEIVKLLMVALLFILVAKWIPVNMMGIFAGYMSAQIIFWIMLVKM
jgi:F0F1-type ATP synthase assembly protein I